jgi:hypothetical protein
MMVHLLELLLLVSELVHHLVFSTEHNVSKTGCLSSGEKMGSTYSVGSIRNC